MKGIGAVVARNLTIQAASEAVALACGLAMAALLSRHLGVEGFGAFNYAFAFMYFFLTLNDLGINTVTIRELSREPDRASDILSSVLTLRVFIAAVALVSAWTAIALWPMDAALRAPLYLLALILPINALNTPALLFQTCMRFELGACANISVRVSGLALVAAAIVAGAGVVGVVAMLLVADLVGLAVVWTLAPRLAPLRFRVDTAHWRACVRAAVPFGVSLVLVALLNRIDVLMLERMASMDAVGLYGAAYRVTNMLEKFPIFVMATLYPIMSRLAVEDPVRLRAVYRRAFVRLGAVAVPVAGLTIVIAPWLMPWLFGEPFAAAVPALRYLVGATACLYLAMTGASLLNSLHRGGDNAVALAAGVVCNIALNMVLIPARGIEGAAIATAVSYFVVLVVTLGAVQRRLSMPAAPAHA